MKTSRYMVAGSKIRSAGEIAMLARVAVKQRASLARPPRCPLRSPRHGMVARINAAHDYAPARVHRRLQKAARRR